MEHISFVLWMVLFPLCSTLESYIDAKKKKITGEKEASEISKFISNIILLIIWISVAKALW